MRNPSQPPNLSQAPYDISPELLRERETFNLHDHLKGVKPVAPSAPSEVFLSKDQLKDLCRVAGLDVVDPIKGGREINQEQVIQNLKAENAKLIKHNASLLERNNELLERAQLAEASAASAISELKSMQNVTTQPEETI